MKTLRLFCALVTLSAPAHAFPAIVLDCHDGDTCRVLSVGHIIKVRFSGIDAPEMKVPGKWGDQPGTYQAHAALSNMIMGQTVDVQDTGQRDHDRMVGRITAMIGGRPIDVNEAMVQQGWAWSALQFEPAGDRDMAMPGLEAQARAARRGIWATGNAVPPWEWRHQ